MVIVWLGGGVTVVLGVAPWGKVSAMATGRLVLAENTQ